LLTQALGKIGFGPIRMRKDIDRFTPFFTQAVGDFKPHFLRCNAPGVYERFQNSCPHLFNIMVKIPISNNFPLQELVLIYGDAIFMEQKIEVPMNDQSSSGERTDKPYEDLWFVFRSVIMGLAENGDLLPQSVTTNNWGFPFDSAYPDAVLPGVLGITDQCCLSMPWSTYNNGGQIQTVGCRSFSQDNCYPPPIPSE